MRRARFHSTSFEWRRRHERNPCPQRDCSAQRGPLLCANDTLPIATHSGSTQAADNAYPSLCSCACQDTLAVLRNPVFSTMGGPAQCAESLVRNWG